MPNVKNTNSYIFFIFFIFIIIIFFVMKHVLIKIVDQEDILVR